MLHKIQKNLICLKKQMHQNYFNVYLNLYIFVLMLIKIKKTQMIFAEKSKKTIKLINKNAV